MTMQTLWHTGLALALVSSTALAGAVANPSPHVYAAGCIQAYTSGIPIPDAPSAWVNLQFSCSHTVFAHVVDPYWLSSAMACVDDHVATAFGYVLASRTCSPFTWFPFGGSVDSPEVPCQPHHIYSAYGQRESHSMETNTFLC